MTGYFPKKFTVLSDFDFRLFPTFNMNPELVHSNYQTPLQGLEAMCILQLNITEVRM